MDCLFCEIAAGNIPSTTLYEDDIVRVILDINPASFGHALILPKVHCASLLECPDEVRDHVYKTAAVLGRKMEEVLNCDGINVLANIRPGAGQTIDHFHVHLIPRYTDQPEKDSLTISQAPLENVPFEQIQEKLSLNNLD